MLSTKISGIPISFWIYVITYYMKFLILNMYDFLEGFESFYYFWIIVKKLWVQIFFEAS